MYVARRRRNHGSRREVRLRRNGWRNVVELFGGG